MMYLNFWPYLKDLPNPRSPGSRVPAGQSCALRPSLRHSSLPSHYREAEERGAMQLSADIVSERGALTIFYTKFTDFEQSFIISRGNVEGWAYRVSRVFPSLKRV